MSSSHFTILSLYRTDITDHSGFKFTYTTRTRKHDAGMILVGHHLAGYNMLIPPRTGDFNVYGTCGAECLAGVSGSDRKAIFKKKEKQF